MATVKRKSKEIGIVDLRRENPQSTSRAVPWYIALLVTLFVVAISLATSSAYADIPPQEGCVSDEECSNGSVCKIESGIGSCVFIDPECFTLEDCGECALACSESGECLYGGADECQEDVDCEGLTGEGSTCDTSSLCGNVCVGGTEYPEPLDPTQCEDDSDCTNATVCLIDEQTGLGTCVFTEPECEKDSDCGGCFGTCIEGACHYGGVSQCSTDSDCGDGYTCDASLCEGTCVEGDPIDPNPEPVDPTEPDTDKKDEPSLPPADGCSSAGGGADPGIALMLTLAFFFGVRRRRTRTHAA